MTAVSTSISVSVWQNAEEAAVFRKALDIPLPPYIVQDVQLNKDANDISVDDTNNGVFKLIAIGNFISQIIDEICTQGNFCLIVCVHTSYPTLEHRHSSHSPIPINVHLSKYFSCKIIL